MHSYIIFLDIDGVLNRMGTPPNRTTTKWRGKVGLEPELVENLNKLVYLTSAEVVICSGWGFNSNTLDALEQSGFHYRTRVIGGVSKALPTRGESIKTWLDNNPTKDFIIIDDELSDTIGEKVPKEIADFLRPNAYKIDREAGLPESITDTVMADCLQEFGKVLAESQVDLPQEMGEIISEDFWDLV